MKWGRGHVGRDWKELEEEGAADDDNTLCTSMEFSKNKNIIIKKRGSTGCSISFVFIKECIKLFQFFYGTGRMQALLPSRQKPRLIHLKRRDRVDKGTDLSDHLLVNTQPCTSGLHFIGSQPTKLQIPSFRVFIDPNF